MEQETQISALVSKATKQLLDRHVRASGMKKGRLVEDALRHHLRALQELPTDVLVHPRLVVDAGSGKTLLSEMEKGKANEALRNLMLDGN